jgi:cytochrome c-type biogenesis protein CcmH
VTLMRRLLAVMFLFAVMTGSALAVNPDEKLADPVLESRAREISRELRCLVCQNQSIDDSDAALARDLRILVRERLTAGDSDSEVIDYLVARYGQFVLLRPRFEPATWGLWLAPALVLLVGAGTVLALFRRGRKGGARMALTPREEARLKAILDEEPRD